MHFGKSGRSKRHIRGKPVLLGGVAAAVAIAVSFAPTGAVAAGGNSATAGKSATSGAKATGEALGNYDARTDPAVKPALQRAAALKAAQPSVKSYRKGLGAEGIVAIDGLTGTPKKVARTDGFLTGASKAGAESIARSFVKKNAAAFGLSAADIDRLTLRKTYADVAGTRHLSFIQTVNGVTVFGQGLKAHVAKDGRLISIDGSPVASLPTSSAAPKLTPTQARSAAVEDAFAKPKAAKATTSGNASKTTSFAGGDQAKLVQFKSPSGLRTAWQTVTSPSSDQMFMHVIDAATGRVLYRRDLIQHDSAKVVENYPGAPRGGNFKNVDLKSKWLPKNSPRLAGNPAHVWSDLNDDNLAQPAEEITKAAPRSFTFPFTRFPLSDPDCTAFVCTWDSTVPNSWETNRKSSGTQLFYYISKFHDHLAKSPISFTREAGNFEAVDGDAIEGNDLDGANTAAGLPDGTHINNANFGTPPDGTPPRMQMYLFRNPAVPGDPWVAAMGSYAADIVYHEFGHGLSNRLVVDADGISTLGSGQAGAMGEAWSDWYAMDFLNNEGYERDTKAEGELRVGQWVGAGRNQIREQPVDCNVGSTSPNCAGTPGGGPGGFTYGDYGKISGGPEVHSDGEIWVQTLWDLREEIGTKKAESLVTRAMELSPANPSFLDMRNSILQADQVVNRGKAHKAIWQVFAHRGMGYFAGSVDGDDQAPVESFAMPPKANTPTGSLSGVVTDSDAGTPVAGAVVAFGGHNSGFGGDYAAVTAADGTYTISGIFAGTYPKVFSRGPGYETVVATKSISNGANSANWQLRRDWAALAGGATVVATNEDSGAPFGCGAAAMFDMSQTNGWSSFVEQVGPDPLDIAPRWVIVKLPSAVDVTELTINPSNTCGDSGSASTGEYSLETSTNGTTWAAAASGDFGVADRKANVIPLAAGTGVGVQYLRYTMLSTQVADLGGTCPGAFSGCDWVDSTELAVYGTP